MLKFSLTVTPVIFGLLCTLRLGTPTPLPEVILAPPTATVTQVPVEAGPTLASTLTPTPLIPDTGWVLRRPGLERRVINLFDETEDEADENKRVEQIYLLRLDPALYRFDLAYDGSDPCSLAEWQAETGALLVVNGGYYREEAGQLIPNGLTIIDGQPIGQSFGDFAGMFVVTEAGPEVRWLRQRPYDPTEPIRAALQSFPLLVKPGGELGFPEQFEDGRRARRTVLGQDRDGHILFLVTSQGHFTLHQLSLYLTNSDLGLDIAVNLDGGTSTGLLLTEPAETIPALLPLPLVITVYSR